jgi:sugar/nucleoside kinase (ribokinase family)
LVEAAMFANHVGALSVTRMGAQSSMPSAEEVDSFVKEMSTQGVNDEQA